MIFGLMNEPNGISAPDWANAAQGTITAIRKTGAKNLILVPGTAYTGAHSWRSTSYGVSNAKALEILKDPGNNLAFEAHQYLDKDYSGTKPVCTSDSVGQEKLQGFTSWLRENKQKGFLGEFATANNPVCDKALEGMLTYMEKNSDVAGLDLVGGGRVVEAGLSLHRATGQGRQRQAADGDPEQVRTPRRQVSSGAGRRWSQPVLRPPFYVHCGAPRWRTGCFGEEQAAASSPWAAQKAEAIPRQLKRFRLPMCALRWRATARHRALAMSSLHLCKLRCTAAVSTTR